MTRWYRGRDGSERFYLSVDEIESTMESELEKARLSPSPEKPAVNVEMFISKHLGAPLDQYAELPLDILGVTEFDERGRVRVKINRDLSEALDGDYPSPGTLGRLRATMAHEASHVVLHRFLFGLDEKQAQLPGVGSRTESRELLRCLKRGVVFRGGGGDWKEVQANLGMAALLMPRELFGILAREEMNRLGLVPGDLEAGHTDSARLVRALAARFEVSCEAARIRLETLKLVQAPGELALQLE